jgi:hypothetical protein
VVHRQLETSRPKKLIENQQNLNPHPPTE